MRSGAFGRKDLRRCSRLLGGLLAVAFWLLAGQAAFAAVNVNPASLPAGTSGVPYDETLTGSGGTGPYSFAVISGTLPTGLMLDSGGDLSGTPGTQGVYNFTVQATDSVGAVGMRAYTVSVGSFSLAVQPNTLPNGTQNVAYSQTLTAVGGNPPYTFTVSSGSLPAGLSLAPGGDLTGTPTGGGTSTFIVQAQDPGGNTGYRTYNLSIGTNSLTITPSTLPNGTQGSAYSQTVTASGGTGGPYTYSVSSGALPSGLSLNAGSGAITGTPSAGGNFNFTIRAVDGNNNFGSQNYAVAIGSNSLGINPASLPNGMVSTAYSQTVTASGGTGGPYTYSIGSGSLPTGLSLNASSGAISGTPTAGGAYSFSIHAVDSNNNFGDRNYTVNIGTNSLTVNPGTLPNGTQGAAYNQTVSATGGTGPYTYAVTAGALPNGLSLNAASGVISGTPSASGGYNFTVRATDANANTGSQAYTVNIAPVPLTVNPSTLPNGTQGTAYSQNFTTTGGTGPFSYAVIAGALPNGLSLNSGSGALAGTPTVGGNFTFTVQSTDSTSNSGTRSYTVNIGTNTLTVSPASLPNGTQGTAYSQNVTASGGVGSYSYVVSAGALPAGLSLNAGSGAISGTPTGSGAAAFTIQASDSNGNTGSRSYNVNIGTSTLAVSPANLPNGTQGTAYSQTVTASGGTGPYGYALTSGALPAGLSLNSGSGAITGTPTGSGPSTFTIKATDANGNIGSRSFSINVGTSTLSIDPGSLPAGSQGTVYDQTVTASGGTGPYTMALVSGVLPAGLTFNAASGRISGTPSGSGVSAFVIRATDANGNIGTRSYSLTIGGNTLSINPANLPDAPQNQAFNQPLTVLGGAGPYSFSVQSGSLPPGLSLSGGAITGTPTGSGSFTFTIQVRDANGNFGTRSYTLSTARADPSSDPDVRGLVAAQAATARRFTDAQTTNVMRRLESLHENFNPCGVSFGINASSINAPAPAYSIDPAPIVKDRSMPTKAPAVERPPASPSSPCGPLSGRSIAVWAGGALEFGRATSNGLVDSSKFSTSGVTAGIDAKVANRLIVGAAVGIGVDHSDIGLKGTISDANSIHGIAYASYKPIEFLYLDALVGYGTLNFDNRRWVPLDSMTVSGRRDGNNWFGSLSLSYDVRRGPFKLSPYARLDAMTARLNQYSETGDANQALTFQGTTVSSTAGVIGLRGSLDVKDGSVIYTPNARVEYKRAFDHGFTQSMFYSDAGASSLYAVNQDGTTRDIFTGAIGLRANFGGSASLEIEYILSAAPSRDASWQSQMIRAMARWSFQAR